MPRQTLRWLRCLDEKIKLNQNKNQKNNKNILKIILPQLRRKVFSQQKSALGISIFLYFFRE